MNTNAAGSGLTTGTTTTHYDGSGTVGWEDNPGGTSSGFLPGLTQGNALNIVTNDSSGTCFNLSTESCTLSVNLTDMRDDIVASASISTDSSVASYSEQTEFGLPQTGQPLSNSRYAWLGEHQKSENNLDGIVLMGLRAYDPTTGRFLQPDPIYGGNENSYVYPTDPINQLDLSGAAHRTTKNGKSGKDGHQKGERRDQLKEKQRVPNPNKRNVLRDVVKYVVIGGVVTAVVVVVVVSVPVDVVVAGVAAVGAGAVAAYQGISSALSWCGI